MKFMITQLEAIKTMYVVSENGLAGSKKAFETLEKPLSTLKGRKFYGLYYPQTDTYLACTRLIIETDQPKLWGFKIMEIPGGKYLQAKIKDWERNTKRIGETFSQMAQDNQVDPDRPSIEFYRSQKELILYLPVSKNTISKNNFSENS